MGVLVPEDFALGSLPNDAERRVVEAFRDGLDDRWLILPTVELREPNRDYELDIVLVHQTFGILDIEVKGHHVEVRQGKWLSRGRDIVPPPLAQAKNNAYALRERLRREVPGLENVMVDYGVAVPNTPGTSGDLPPGADWVQVLTAAHLEDPTDAVETLAMARWTLTNLTADHVEAIVALLRPDADFAWDPTARMRSSRARLDELCSTQIQALERLDVNRKVVALGAAGTGKTRLAMAWARRGFGRQERVLLTCYNEPLAERMAEHLVDDEDLVIGPFLRVALDLEGMPPLAVPDDADHQWWTITAVGHLHAHWHQVTDRFDTIVVDEAQDFSPAWIAQLEALLDPDGPRRLLIAADPAQELYVRGFQVPSPDDGWTHCELVSNCRNALEIGRLLRRHLGGAPAPALGPGATDVRFVAVADTDGAATAARSELDRLVLDEERDPTQVAVLTFSSALRDRLLDELELVRWEQRGDGVVCENVHRVKGLEADTVVLVADTDEVPRDLLYVGISRAVSELVLIAPPPVGTGLGLKPI